MRLPKARLDQLLARFQEVEARLGSGLEGAELVRLAREAGYDLKPMLA